MAARVRRRGPRTLFAIFVLIAIHLTYSLAALGLSLWSTQRTSQGLRRSARADIARLVQEARSMVVAGGAAAATADGAGPALVSLLPVVDDEIGILRFGGHVAEDATRFGLSSVEELERIAGSDRGLAEAFYRDGRIDFNSLGGLADLAAEADRFFEGLIDDASRLPEPEIGPLVKLRIRMQRTLTSAANGLGRARLLLGTLPELTGRDEPKSYLLALQSPSEARGSGGIIGVYAILRAEDGRLQLAHVGPILELGRKVRHPIDAPAWFEGLYGDLLALEEMRHVNLALHFPTVAQVLLAYYEQAEKRALDGVITLDPIVLEQIATGTPPLRGPGWEVRVDDSNARRVLMHDSYLRFGRFRSKAQNRFLQGLVRSLMDHLSTGRANAPAVLLGLAKAAKWQHLKLFSTDADLQKTLGRLEINGDFTHAGPNVQAVFHNNFTGSKVDYFLHRDQRTTVEVRSNGDAEITTSIRLDNRAPTEPSSLLIRPLLRKFPNGHNRMTLSFLLPRAAESIEVRVAGKRTVPLRGNEAGFPVAWDIVDVAAGDMVEASIGYRLPGALSEGAFAMTLWPQALVRPDEFTFELTGPEILDVTPRRRLHDGAYVLSGRLFGPKRITARIGS